MSLIKTSLFNGIAVVVRVATGIVLNKIMAVYVGPAGYAIIGQFQNAVSIIVSLAGGLLATGITKITAQHFDDERRQHAVWQTAVRFSLIASLLTGLFLLITGKYLSEWLLHRADMMNIFFWLAMTLPAMCANNILLAIVNGKKEIGIYVTANIVGSVISMLVTGFLAYSFGLYGALVAFMVNPAFALLTTGLLVARRPWIKLQFLWGETKRQAFSELLGFGLMGLTSALVVPISHILIRDHLVETLGLDSAGYWQASWKISEIYLMLVTTTLSTYYLPRLAEIRTSQELKYEITKVYRLVMPIVIIGAATIYILRDLIIYTLFTPDFLPMRELFQWQLMGDVIKIGSWIIGFTMLGRGMVKYFVATEIIFSISFVLLTWIMVAFYGLVGVSIAYVINYCMHWICMMVIVSDEMKQMKAEHGKD